MTIITKVNAVSRPQSVAGGLEAETPGVIRRLVAVDHRAGGIMLKSGLIREPIRLPGEDAMGRERSCNHPEEHQEHLCELMDRLPKAELDALKKNPRYVCANCGGRVHSGRNLCLPRRIKDA